jgi:chaperonin GroEL
MQGKVARINIGGATEDERREKFDRVEDAICAIRAADEQGCVAGGGSVFLRISGALIPDENLNKDELDGFNSVKEALTAPFLQLLDNAKIKPTKPQKDVLSSKKECGFNLKTEKVENLFEAGVLDSAKVLKCSLVNAISVTNLYVMTNASIVNTPKP